jgi:2,4-dienoyl-CoA reductase-like NADH-dependent reductase (Old Yellow Enzyme family)/thioredoxin reductase
MNKRLEGGQKNIWRKDKMENKYAALFQKGKINKLELKNRLVMSPMGVQYTETDGRMSERSIAYFAERAKGGVGMIITEALFATRTSGGASHYIGDATCLPRLTELTDIVHGYGAKICAQMGAGLGRIEVITPAEPNPPAASAIPSYYNPKVLCRPLTVDEIHQRVELIGSAAKRMMVAGFDAIEIHAHAGYLIDQFMSKEWNLRTDEYGGSLENRMRYATDIVKSIRKNVGPNVPILFRIPVDHKYPGGRDINESIPIVQILEAAGVDALDIDAGCYGPTFYWLFPPSYLGDASMLDLATAMKKAVKIPILNSGTHTPETALKAVSEGAVDFIMMGRPLLADPDLPNKLRVGKREDVRPCIRCNENCVRINLFMQKALSCAVNTRTGRERTYNITKSDSSKKVVVVGSGPAGLEAARVAALKGHEVTVYEKNKCIGGQASAAATPPFKNIDRLLEWFEIQLKKLAVKIYFNTEITPSSPELANADEIFIAFGAESWVPPIEGIDSSIVVDVRDAHLKPDMVKGNKIIVAGGGLSGVDCALELAIEGKEVTIVELLDNIAIETAFINQQAIKAKIAEYKVNVLTKHKVLRISSDGIVAADANGNEVVIKGDTVITAFGTRANKALADTIQDKYPDAVLIGDCNKVGNIGTSIIAGFTAAYAIQ